MGVSYLAPADIYRQPTDKVPRYFATPLTEHYPVIHAAKYELGMRGTGIFLVCVAVCNLLLFHFMHVYDVALVDATQL